MAYLQNMSSLRMDTLKDLLLSDHFKGFSFVDLFYFRIIRNNALFYAWILIQHENHESFNK